jgi:hypothetical protein
MTQLQAGYGQAVREIIDRMVAERRNALTAPEGTKVTDACGSSSAPGRAPPQEVKELQDAGPGRGIPRPYPPLGAAGNPIDITGGEPL